MTWPWVVLSWWWRFNIHLWLLSLFTIKNILVQCSIITEFAQNHTRRMGNKELVCMVPKGNILTSISNLLFSSLKLWKIHRGYYTVTRRYEFYVRVARTISHEWAQRTSEILFSEREHKIHIFEPTCNVLFIIWRNQFNKSKRRESWRHWTIRHSQRWHTENMPLGSRMKWRMESMSGLVPSKTLSSI